MNVEQSKKAIKAASDFYKSVIPDSQSKDIRLEGIEMVDKPDAAYEEKDYKITLSYPEEGYIFADKTKRHINVFIIDGKNFELVSMGTLDECKDNN